MMPIADPLIGGSAMRAQGVVDENIDLTHEPSAFAGIGDRGVAVGMEG